MCVGVMEKNLFFTNNADSIKSAVKRIKLYIYIYISGI